MIGAVMMFTEPGMLTSMQGREVIRPEEPELAEGELGLEDKVLFVFVGRQLFGRRSGSNVLKTRVEE
jgi:hypothetical protein